MSVQAELDRLSGAKSAIAAAITDKGVTVPDGTMLDGMAALIAAIESGGGVNIDWRGFPFVTGTFTPSEDMQSSFLLTFGEGNRLHFTAGAYQIKPFFILMNEGFPKSNNGGYINYVVQCSYYNINSTPSHRAFIHAGVLDGALSTTYCSIVNLTYSYGDGYVASPANVTIESITIPCTSTRKLMAGGTYRYILAAPDGSGVYSAEVI